MRRPQGDLDVVAGSETIEREEDGSPQHGYASPLRHLRVLKVWPGLCRASLMRAPAREPGQRRRVRRRLDLIAAQFGTAARQTWLALPAAGHDRVPSHARRGDQRFQTQKRRQDTQPRRLRPVGGLAKKVLLPIRPPARRSVACIAR